MKKEKGAKVCSEMCKNDPKWILEKGGRKHQH